MEGRRVDDHIIRSSVNLVHPVVLRNVFSMALDEMDVVYDLDTEVCFINYYNTFIIFFMFLVMYLLFLICINK